MGKVFMLKVHIQLLNISLADQRMLLVERESWSQTSVFDGKSDLYNDLVALLNISHFQFDTLVEMLTAIVPY